MEGERGRWELKVIKINSIFFQHFDNNERAEEAHTLRAPEGAANLHNMLEAAEKSAHALAAHDVEP